jgi:hypothetical protein
LLAAASGVVPASTAGAATTAKGSAYVVTPAGASLNSGGSGTPFSLLLPSDAACPADTAHHGYLVYSYVTPLAADPTSLTFPGGYPSSNLNLITTGGEPFVTNATAPNSGAILRLPMFDWSRYDHHPDVLPPGTYNVGIACALNQGHVVAYWNNRIRFTATATDAGGFIWQVVGAKAAPASSGGGSNIGLVAGLVLAVAVVVAVGLAVGLRRPRGARSTSGA